MDLKKTVVIAMLSLLSLTAQADEQVTICESEGTITQARIVFRDHSPGRYEALEMEYQGRNVMLEPLSRFNHMGFIVFEAEHGILFRAFEFSEDFTVTVTAFGGEPLVTARGKCKLM